MQYFQYMSEDFNKKQATLLEKYLLTILRLTLCLNRQRHLIDAVFSLVASSWKTSCQIVTIVKCQINTLSTNEEYIC